MRGDSEKLYDLKLFSGIDRADCAALLGCMNTYTRTYKKGEFILHEQDHLQDVGIVVTGTVHILKEDVWGRRTLLAYVRSGELFGESFALCPEIAIHLAFVAAANTRVLFLPLDHVLTPCSNHCPFHTTLAQNLFRLLGEKNTRLMEKIEIDSKSSMREKILAYLSSQAQMQGSKYITVPLNRTEMASFLHANRSAMTRELTAMQADGLIEFDRNTFVLK